MMRRHDTIKDRVAARELDKLLDKRVGTIHLRDYRPSIYAAYAVLKPKAYTASKEAFLAMSPSVSGVDAFAAVVLRDFNRSEISHIVIKQWFHAKAGGGFWRSVFYRNSLRN